MTKCHLSSEAYYISEIVPLAAAGAAGAARRFFLRCVRPTATRDGVITASIGRRCAPDDTVVHA